MLLPKTDKETKREVYYTFALVIFFGAGDIFLAFANETFTNYLAVNVIPKVYVPAALTMLYLRWAILEPTFRRRLEFTPITSRLWRTNYVLEGIRVSIWVGIDMICLSMFSLEFYIESWNVGLHFIAIFVIATVVPYCAILSYFLANKKL